MHIPINVKSPNNISEWQMGFNSAFKELKQYTKITSGKTISGEKFRGVVVIIEKNLFSILLHSVCVVWIFIQYKILFSWACFVAA